MDPSMSSDKSGIIQPAPLSYQENQGHPNTGYTPPGSYPSPSGYPAQQYGYPGGQPIPQAQYGQGPYSGQAPITVQPPVCVTTTPPANPSPDYLYYSIFTMICCCLPLGVAALVHSIFTRNANMSRDQPLAEKNSRMARILNHSAVGIGLVFIVLYIIIVATYATYVRTRF